MKTRAAILSVLILVPSAAYAHGRALMDIVRPNSRGHFFDTLLKSSPAHHLKAGGSTCSAYNPALYKWGNTYQVVSKVSEKGMHDYTGVVDSKVIGPATFHGHNAVDIRTHAINSGYPSGRVSVIADIFYGVGRKFVYLYGDRSQVGAEAFSDPPYSYPKRYVLNVPYAETITQYTVGGGVHSSFTLKKTTTFVGTKRITVPAGTFVACKMKTVVSSGSNGSRRNIDYSWLVASGRYAGLPIKSTDLESTRGSPAKVVLKKIVLSLRLNGK